MMRPPMQSLLADADAPGGGGGLPDGLIPEGESTPETRSGRQASVSLRQGRMSGVDERELLDPANQSLAEALRITFRLLQLAMVVLIGLFALSGFQSVKENERGIRLLFGRIDRSDLPPGFQFSAPFPVGELVKVDQGTKEMKLETEFWFMQRPEDRDKPLDRANSAPKLNPANDGSMITADGNIAHARWQVRYRRTDAAKFAQNIVTEDEESIVRAAVKRGVVQAVARTTIDDLLKQTHSDESSVSTSAREVAQRMLDRLNSGITIEQLRMTDPTPPIFVRGNFIKVQTAAQNAGKEREKAESDARQRLNATAGDAVTPLLEKITAYELAIEKKDDKGAAAVLEQIDAIIEGRSTPGEAAGVQASGDVARILSEARQYRSEIVAQRQRDLETFRAKLEQFQSNPLVMVHREWEEALKSFLSRPTTQLAIIPPGTSTLELTLNPDPEILKDMIRARNLDEAQEARQRRQAEQQAERYKTRTGLQSKE
jgi:regulator of protease activity HflC (stomatin/prohibitin superfamily)